MYHRREGNKIFHCEQFGIAFVILYIRYRRYNNARKAPVACMHVCQKDLLRLSPGLASRILYTTGKHCPRRRKINIACVRRGAGEKMRGHPLKCKAVCCARDFAYQARVSLERVWAWGIHVSIYSLSDEELVGWLFLFSFSAIR